MEWPEFDNKGDLPVGIHRATLAEMLQHFGTGTLRRTLIGQRLDRIYRLASSTGQLARFVVFGSFVTAKPEPADVDVFIIMEDSFELDWVVGEAAVVFDHEAAQNFEGASVFGFVGWPPLAASELRWSTGKSNATKPGAE